MSLKAKLGISPVAWWNDDLESLSDDVSLDECLRQAAEAGLTAWKPDSVFLWIWTRSHRFCISIISLFVGAVFGRIAGGGCGKRTGAHRRTTSVF